MHEPEYVKCDECLFLTKKRRLKGHKERKHAGKPFECNICDYKAKNMDKVEDHKKGIHEGNKYQCDHCEYNCILNAQTSET